MREARHRIQQHAFLPHLVRGRHDPAWPASFLPSLAMCRDRGGRWKACA